MLKAIREDGTEVKLHPISKVVLIFGGLLALAVTVLTFVGIGAMLATI